jgi:carbonic anhydrase
MFGFGRGKNSGGKNGDGKGTQSPGHGRRPFSGAVGDLTPDEALQFLKDGNRAFLTGQGVLEQVSADDLDEQLQAGQKPFAVIVACADSRTPPTILFNQGLGRLFIVRVAGNTLDRRGVASVVYAVKHLKTPIVVVLGHTGCGAVGAAEAIVDGRAEMDPALEDMITPIIPAVLEARHRGSDNVSVAAVERNACRVASRLRTLENALDDALNSGRLKIVAAVKDLRTGEVRFLD